MTDMPRTKAGRKLYEFLTTYPLVDERDIHAFRNDILAIEEEAAALTAQPESAGPCDCTVDAELGAGSICPACGHRDHGSSGCAARLTAEKP